MINIILIILSIIGLLKLVSLFILALLQIYYYIKGNKVVEAHRDFVFCFDGTFYIIPTIDVSYCAKYFTVSFHWLKFDYYESTKLEFENEEK